MVELEPSKFGVRVRFPALAQNFRVVNKQKTASLGGFLFVFENKLFYCVFESLCCAELWNLHSWN